MNSKENPQIEFTSSLTRFELIATLVYFPIHIILLPMLLTGMITAGKLGEADANVLCYGIGLFYFVFCDFRFLRKEFDPLCDHVLNCLWQVVLSYAIMMALNMIVAGAISGMEYLISGENLVVDNQNNDAIAGLAGSSMGKTKAIALFLAPIVEELLFRGGLFAPLRERSRVLAYAVSMLAFSVYHVWGYAIADPSYWIYIIQYLPASYALCRCYEKTNSIWACMILHMCVNNVALQVLSAVENML